jgi:Putative zinc-finger
MKQLWKTEDRAMERLLHGHVSQQSGPKVCKQFDPDLANAYIEHSLTPVEREGFEQHLSLCARCRTATVALVRLAETEAPASLVRPGQQATQGWRERLSSLAGAMTTPRWAMAATAVLVAAISVPVFMSGLTSRKEKLSATAQEAAGAQPASSSSDPADQSRMLQPSPATGVADPQESVGLVARNPAPENNHTTPTGRAQGPVITDKIPASVIVANKPSAEVSVPVAPSLVEQNEKKEQAAGAPAGQVQSRDQVANASQAPTQQQQAGTGDQLGKIDPQGARPASEAKKDSAHVSVLKSGRADGEERAAGDTKIRPEDNNAPPSPIAGAESGSRRALAQPAPSSMRDGRRLSETVRSRGTAERKIGKKRFWLRDEVWTDNDYKPEKEMPMVTLVRDSDVFNEVIGKRAALKGYLTAFAENERAIVVYKGTIYKLIPQDASK